MTTKSFHREVGLINVKTKPFVIQVFKAHLYHFIPGYCTNNYYKERA